MVRQRMDLGRIDASFSALRGDQEKSVGDIHELKEKMENMIAVHNKERRDMLQEIEELKTLVNSLQNEVRDVREKASSATSKEDKPRWADVEDSSEVESEKEGFTEQKRRSKKNKKKKEKTMDPDADEERDEVGKGEQQKVEKHYTLEDIHNLSRKYGLTKEEFGLALVRKIQQLRGDPASGIDEDGFTGKLQKFLSEFGEEFDAFVSAELMKNEGFIKEATGSRTVELIKGHENVAKVKERVLAIERTSRKK